MNDQIPLKIKNTAKLLLTITIIEPLIMVFLFFASLSDASASKSVNIFSFVFSSIYPIYLIICIIFSAYILFKYKKQTPISYVSLFLISILIFTFFGFIAPVFFRN